MSCFSTLDALFTYIEDAGLLAHTSASLILVGGCARAGKSTLAAALSKRIALAGIDSRVVELDCWLISMEKRRPNSTVMERYEADAIVDSILGVLSGETVYPPVYDAVTRRRIAQHGRQSFAMRSGVLIVDGVIALALAKLLETAALKIYVSVDDAVRLARLMDFYHRTKGLNLDEARTIIEARENEEVPFIKRTRANANVVYAS